MKDIRRKRLVELLNGHRFNGDRALFLRASGITKGRLTQLLDEDEAFGDVAAENLCEKLGLAKNYFNGTNEIPLSAQQVGHTAAIQEVGNVSAARAFVGEVPVISWVQAGAWQDIADTIGPDDVERYLPIFRGHSSYTYALKVRGDSMTASHGKSYPEGCYVIVDPAKCSPVNGDRIIAMVRGAKEATFKVYKEEDGRRWLAPLNKDIHDPIKEPFEVLGTVIGKWEDE